MAMPDTVRWTRKRVLALPFDGTRYELIDGELLVTPTPRPRHQFAIRYLDLKLQPYVTAHQLGHCLPLAADLEPEPGHLTQPDLFVIPGAPRFRRGEDAPKPLLVVEILSPSTARYDRTLKRRFYQRAGIPEYWVVDLDARVIERWRPDDLRPEVIDQVLEWQPLPTVPPLQVALGDYFDEIDGST